MWALSMVLLLSAAESVTYCPQLVFAFGVRVLVVCGCGVRLCMAHDLVYALWCTSNVHLFVHVHDR